MTLDDILARADEPITWPYGLGVYPIKALPKPSCVGGWLGDFLKEPPTWDELLPDERRRILRELANAND